MEARHWRFLAELPSSLEERDPKTPEEHSECLLRLIMDHVGADCGFIVYGYHERTDAVQDPLLGWRVAAMHAATEDAKANRMVLEVIQDESYLRDPMARFSVQGAGAVRSYGFDDIPASELKTSAAYAISRARHLGERLVGVSPLGERAEAFIGLDRAFGSTPFGAEEREFLKHAARLLRGTMRRQATLYGLVDASQRLSPREQQVLMALLTGEAEKSIALELELSHHYVHQVVRKIYTKFGVSSRAELLAHVLR